VSRPIRFTFILALAAAATVFAAVGGWRYARASAPLSGPINVLSIDTLRADHLPAYGYRGVKTPAIDVLAADGVVFERAFAHTPQTLPAHMAMLTGRLPFENGVRDDIGFALKSGERLLPSMLRDRGYATGGVVSTLLLRKDTGIAQGFDFFDGDVKADRPGGTVIRRDGAASEAIAENWLGSIGSARAFLFLHIDEPHSPYAPPDRFSGYSPYDGTIAYSDEIVGRLVRYLKSHQLYDRSTIVLLADHGEGLGDHGEQEHGLLLYAEALHVPLIVKQEGNVGAGSRVGSIVQQIDLVPTILDLVKAPIPGNLRGLSLKPLLDGAGRLQVRPVYSEALYGRYHFGWSPVTALIDERYHYIRSAQEELYDLHGDPRERHEMAGGSIEAQRMLSGSLDQMIGSAPLPRPAPVNAEVRDRLQAIAFADVPASDGVLPAPNEKREVEVIERYRAAMHAAADRRWSDAIDLLQQIVVDEPQLADAWRQLGDIAAQVDRFDVATDAFRHYAELMPADPDGYLRSAATLLRQRKLEDARAQATSGLDAAGDADARSRAAAHELLARIALAKHDAGAAREEAGLAHEADPALPMPEFVDARVLYDQGRLVDALVTFEQALAQRKGGPPLADLHYYAADCYSRLQRYDEAESEFLAELRDWPHNVRARGGLAMLYQATGRADAAAATIGDLTDISPTPESYALAARLWTTIGNRLQADAIRAESRVRFPPAPRRSATVH
jgi:arylsulfatase A-like enzyme/tetratricopeptide (TPR) repeat protein